MSKILEFLTEKIDKTEKKLFTTMSPEKLEAKMLERGLSKEEFKEDFENLLKGNKVFYLKSGEEKIAYDGSYKFDEDLPNRKWFVDKEKFSEISKNEREYKDKLTEKESIKLKEKTEKVKELSENAQKIFNTINDLTKNGEEKAYINSKEILKATGINFEEFKDAARELANNRITFSLKISKNYEIEKDGVKEFKNESAYVYTNKNSVIPRVLKREEIKEKISCNEFKNKSMEFTKKSDKALQEELEEKDLKEKDALNKGKKTKSNTTKVIPKKRKKKEENER